MGLYTIGHTNHTHEEFLNLLQMYEINYILDIRSIPYSKYTPQFNKETISYFLKENGIEYYQMGKYFGARPNDRSLYSEKGYLDFEKVRESKNFIYGLENIKKGLQGGNNIALMCTERDPFDCHRAIMVSRGFELSEIDVQHIRDDGNLESQKKINERLLKNLEKKYKIDIYQYSFFSENKSLDEWLKEAYRLRNKEIGFHIQNEM